MDNVINEVANFSCTCVCHVGQQDYGCDCHCLGTKRQWPSLLETCKYCSGKNTRQTKGQFRANIPCWDCTDGYNMNVTLENIEKVLVLEGIHHFDIDYEDDDIEVVLTPTGRSSDEDDLPWGAQNTLLEAFCVALLDHKRIQNQKVQQAHVRGCHDYGENYCNYCCIDMAEKDLIIALKQVRIEELEAQIKPKSIPTISLEEYIRKAQIQYPPVMPFAVLSRFMGDALVQCSCGNEYTYMKDEVMCRRCRCIFPMGDFPRE